MKTATVPSLPELAVLRMVCCNIHIVGLNAIAIAWAFPVWLKKYLNLEVIVGRLLCLP